MPASTSRRQIRRSGSSRHDHVSTISLDMRSVESTAVPVPYQNDSKRSRPLRRWARNPWSKATSRRVLPTAATRLRTPWRFKSSHPHSQIKPNPGTNGEQTMLDASDDDRIIDLLAVSQLSTTRLARELRVDDGALTGRLLNVLLPNGTVEVCGADGSTPIWTLTEDARRARRSSE